MSKYPLIDAALMVVGSLAAGVATGDIAAAISKPEKIVINYPSERKIVAQRFEKGKKGVGIAELYLSRMPKDEKLRKELEKLAKEIAETMYEKRKADVVVKLEGEEVKSLLFGYGLLQGKDIPPIIIDSIKAGRKSDATVPVELPDDWLINLAIAGWGLTSALVGWRDLKKAIRRT